MHWICGFAGKKMVKTILKLANGEINKPDREGLTPLAIACYNGREDIVKELLKDPRIQTQLQNNQGLSPVHVAFERKQVSILKVLVNSKSPKITIPEKGYLFFFFLKNIYICHILHDNSFVHFQI